MVSTLDQYIAARSRALKKYRSAVKRGDRATAAIHREQLDMLNREIDSLR